MNRLLQMLWSNEQGQVIAEYAVMLAVTLVLVVGTIRLVGTNASNVFWSVASSVQRDGRPNRRRRGTSCESAPFVHRDLAIGSPDSNARIHNFIRDSRSLATN